MNVFKLAVLNANRLTNKLLSLEFETIRQFDFSDIISATETGFKPSVDSVISLHKGMYNVVRRDYRDGGGVALFVKSSICLEVLRKGNEIETIWLQLTMESTKMIVGVYYKPHINLENEVDLLRAEFNEITASNTRCMITLTGDLNLRDID